MRSDPRSKLPSIDGLLDREDITAAVARHGHQRVTAALRDAVGEARREMPAPDSGADPDEIAGAVLTNLRRQSERALGSVINATGVVLHTNLGRAPLSDRAIESIIAVAGPTALEMDLATGKRGGREDEVRRSACQLTGAESAFVVNNGAAALVLSLAALADGRDVLVSRGELVEIGGSFRLPEIVAAAGVPLREVGTTNRTRCSDYEEALSDRAGLILRVHPSNYRIEGFTERPSAAALARVAGEHAVPYIHDIGSGLLQAGGAPVAADEPNARDAVTAGADLVVFSGDKLVGGPQAGLMVGRREFVDACRRHPLARALRLDKLRLAALETTLAAHEAGHSHQVPVWAMLRAPIDDLRRRARAVASGCGGDVVSTDSVVGGGAAPGATLPSAAVTLEADPEALARRLRLGTPPVVARIADGRVLADVRTVPPARDRELTAAMRAAAGVA